MFCIRSASRGLVHVVRGGRKVLCARLSSSLVNIEKNEETGTAILSMNKPPLNALDTEMLTQMTAALENIENNKSMQGLIIASDRAPVFSTGLDIFELYQTTEERFHTFYRTLQNFWIKLYGSRLATVAAITGHAPAGGCLMAMSCDYRIMADGKYGIGLNETQLGLVAPYWFADTMKNLIGHYEAERALMVGKMFSPQEALQVGLVNQLQREDQVLPAAQKEIRKWIRIPGPARHRTKQTVRGPTIERLVRDQRQEAESMLGYIQQDRVQDAMGKYLESLASKKQKRSAAVKN